jgi:hypothetical protein
MYRRVVTVLVGLAAALSLFVGGALAAPDTGLQMLGFHGDSSSPSSSADRMAEALAKKFGVSTQSVMDLRDMGLGWGEVSHALELSALSVMKPDAIAQMHLDGMGWGEIAKSLGVKLGGHKDSDKNDDKGKDAANHDANDDKGKDAANHDAMDDKGKDAANHDAMDDKGKDQHQEVKDDKGKDSTTHDATDDKGKDTKKDDKGQDTKHDDKGQDSNSKADPKGKSK